eukprot:2585497-Karenia_brevis.AAC.1
MKWGKKFQVTFRGRRNHEDRETKRVAAIRAGATARRILLASSGMAKHHKELTTIICPIGERRGRQMQICKACGCYGRDLKQMERQPCEAVVHPSDECPKLSPRNMLRLNMRRRLLNNWAQKLRAKNANFTDEEKTLIAELQRTLSPKAATKQSERENKRDGDHKPSGPSSKRRKTQEQ